MLGLSGLCPQPLTWPCSPSPSVLCGWSLAAQGAAWGGGWELTESAGAASGDQHGGARWQEGFADRPACCCMAPRAGRVGERTRCCGVRRWRDDVMTGHFPAASRRCYLQAPDEKPVAFSSSLKAELSFGPLLLQIDPPAGLPLCPGVNKPWCTPRGWQVRGPPFALGSCQEDRSCQAPGTLVYLCLGACWLRDGWGRLC